MTTAQNVKKFNIISNIDNGVGLQKDAELLKGLLESWGHSAKMLHYRKRNEMEEAQNVDANIFLEVVNYDLLSRNISRENWFIPNPEWFAPWDHKNGLPDFQRILCKTPDAVNIMQKFTDLAKIHYIGFESRDLYDPTIPRERKFLHVAGQSRYKNTMATTYAFSKLTFVDDLVMPHLTIVGAYPDEYAFSQGAKNITTYERISDEQMKQLLNSHQFHVMCAGYEGWGHALNEGLGVGAVVITTNHPPMCDFPGVARDLLVPYQDTIVELAAMRARVVAPPIRDAVGKAIKMKPEQIAEISAAARQGFLTQRDQFRENLKQQVETLS